MPLSAHCPSLLLLLLLFLPLLFLPPPPLLLLFLPLLRMAQTCWAQELQEEPLRGDPSPFLLLLHHLPLCRIPLFLLLLLLMEQNHYYYHHRHHHQQQAFW
jgi:hypothetical protein